MERIAEPIVVTGATGFIGRRLTARLLQDGFSPHALVLPSDPIPIEWGDRVRIFHGDVADRLDVMNAMREVRTVFHLAAVVGDWGSHALHRRVTVNGTEHVLAEAARREARAILVSSVVVYGHRIGREICDESLPFGRPLGPYSKSKQEQERIARRLEAQRSLKVTIVRPTNVYGAGSRPWVDTPLEVMRAQRPILVGDGRQCAGLTHVDNVVDVLVRAAASHAAVGRTYNASDDNGVTWLRYFTELASLAGAPAPRSIPRAPAAIAAVGCEAAYRLLRIAERPPITREALNLVGSNHRVPIERAKHELGYAPRVSHQEAMKEIAAHLGV
ncbi:MAG TPA: NAD-dependent epimerase/dehydratase family protein [Polyangiaceae bacterium]|nr:NAD-dependent epimerase/dehydratase family protein [Polyangiaceae bacterium]